MSQDELIHWKTDAWKDPGMVAWYSQRMVEQSSIIQLKNRLETDLCGALSVGGELLDVGIGTGRASLPLAAQGKHVTGVDSSQAMLDECKRLAGDIPIELLPADLANLPFETNRFDTVMALNVLTHFPHWQQVVKEWSRVAKPGGRIVFDVYSKDHYEAAGAPALSEDSFSGFNLRITLAELVTELNQQGLSIAAIVPYGGLLGNGTNFWINERLELKHWWNRLLSWMGYDDRLFDFAVFLEQRCFAYLSTFSTGRFMVALDKRADVENNQAWLQRNAELNERILQGVSLDTLEPFIPEDTAEWRRTLNHHLEYLRNRVLFYHLWSMFHAYSIPFNLRSFLDERHASVLQLWHEQVALDKRTMNLLREWHRIPELAGTLTYEGIPLGNGLEYQLMQDFLRNYHHIFSEGKL